MTSSEHDGRAAVGGIHHVTCIAGDAQENLDFYSGVLGMRLVKRTINQDVPHTYHLFYADAEGHPGTDVTFFPWPDQPPMRRGVGLGCEVALTIPAGTADYWSARLSRYGIVTREPELRRGARALPFTDPHGLDAALVESTQARSFTPWEQSPVPAERQIRGVESVRLLERELAPTAEFLEHALGLASMGAERGWHRFGAAGGGSGAYVEICEIARLRRGAWGQGAMHHVAWRVPDDATQLAIRQLVADARRRPTQVIDRFWFRSVYFLEPGGVLFEVATDGPGFTADESLGALGEKLVLPPWFEPERQVIENALPTLRSAGTIV